MPDSASTPYHLLPVSFADVEAAEARLKGAIVETPCLYSATLSQLTGAKVFLKFENLQFTASFKERGALNRLLSLDEAERRRGVIAVSAGNHAQGVAYHAARNGIRATIVMPVTTPTLKVARVREHGARVELVGQDFAQAQAHMVERARVEGLVVVHPFDDPAIIAGQGTAALEMLRARPEIDTIAVPVGGGGLIAGSAIAAQGFGRAVEREVRVVGVQSESHPGMVRATGRDWQEPGPGSTVAEGIAVLDPGQITRAIVGALVHEVCTVSEDAIEEAIALLLGVEKTLCEGAGAAGIAALTSRPDLFAGRTVGVILSGGNIDTRVLVSVLQRHLARAGYLVRIRVELPDRPGALSGLTAALEPFGCNIYELRHERLSPTSRAKDSTVVLDLELRDPRDCAPLLTALEADGYPVRQERL